MRFVFYNNYMVEKSLNKVVYNIEKSNKLFNKLNIENNKVNLNNENGVNSKDNNLNKIKLMDALSLAFVGDAVHSLFVRSILVSNADYKQKDLQAKTSAIVNANNQSKTLTKIEHLLSDEERAIMLRARNAHTNNKAKNSTLQDYKKSTAYEAILGLLYLKQEYDRLFEFLKQSLSNEEE